MKHTLSILLIILLSMTLQAQEKYSRIKILTGKEGLKKLAASGIETDHGLIRPNVWFITELSQSEIEKVRAAGLSYEVLTDDVIADFIERNKRQPVNKQGLSYPCSNGTWQINTPSQFGLGGMGGHLYYQEMLSHLDNMVALYPNLITVKAPIDSPNTTIEGRPVYYVKISDNPNVNEPEPQVLYTAIHHAREPVSMHQLIFYMWYLLENYATDPLIQQIVNTTEMYLIPCLNPDGYIYNEITDPAGGGMWRKNRRNNADGTYGVDLNRNYGYNWGFDNNGSSPNGIDETYRGTAPFSEPETDMLRNFINAHNFRIALNYHTFGNLLIYPWGYQPNIYTPDSALYVNMASCLTEFNNYTFGTANQTVGYVVNGSSDDWMYGEQTSKPKIMAMTPETGEWFWPSQFEIEDLCKGTLYQNVLAAQLAGPYADLTETSPKVIGSVNGFIHFTVQQLGLDTTAVYTVSLSPLTSNIVSTGAPKQFSNLSLLQQIVDSISFTLLSTNLSYGSAVRFALSINNGLYTLTDTIEKIFGPAQIVYSNSFANTTGWSSTGWNVTTQQFFSPPSSITDSPNGNYPSNTLRTFTKNTQVNLTNAVYADLSFYAKWAIEPNYDFAQVLISIDNGGSWIPLCGKYTVEGTNDQDPNQPVYEGFQYAWVKEEFDLTPYTGNNIRLRFMLSSDGFEEYDGFYFDDLVIRQILPGGLGMDESHPEMLSVYAFPNPAVDKIQFSYWSSSPARILITDAAGRLIYHSELKPGTDLHHVNTENFESGIYFWRFVSENRQAAHGKFSVLKQE